MLACAASVAVAGACSNSSPPPCTTCPPPIAVGLIKVVAPGGFQNAALDRNLHVQLTDTVYSTTGSLLANVPVTWNSKNTAIATVDLNGKVTAVDTGQTTIFAATLGDTSAAFPILVTQSIFGITPFQYTPLAANSPGSSPDSLRVQVTGRTGAPLIGVTVTFAVTAGGGSVSPATAVTSNSGTAATKLTTGTTPGVNTVTATAVDLENNPVTYIKPSTASFSVTTFNAIIPVAGNNQSGVILSTLPVEPSVKVVDSTGKVRPGIPVTFAATSGGKVQTTVVSTGADGIASPGTWTLGDTPGEQDLVATVDNATGLLKATGTGTPIYYKPTLIAAGQFSTCAINTDATASCWGQEPQVGDTGATDKSLPTATVGGVHFTSLVNGISSNLAHVCGIATDKSIYCWGFNSLPDTTTGTTTVSASIPTRYPSSISWVQVAPGQTHNCALASDQNIYCWGDDSVGQLGDRLVQKRRFSPAPVFGGFHFQAVTSGGGHSCGLALDGSAYCWGFNTSGQLGNGTTAQGNSPTAVSSGLTFKQISAGDSFTCGITTTNKPYCWGNLGASSPTVTTPHAYSTSPDLTSISSGGFHACGLASDGTAYCWGDNSAGQLGDSTLTFRANPTAVATTVKFASISAGYGHTCGIATNGAVMCWGINQSGELGTDTSTKFRTQPRYIVLGVTPPSGSGLKLRALKAFLTPKK